MLSYGTDDDWLGELYRKFHQIFVLLDDKRRQDVARELGAGFNPFEAHARSIVALARACHERAAALALFPELSLSAYSIDDLLL